MVIGLLCSCHKVYLIALRRMRPAPASCVHALLRLPLLTITPPLLPLLYLSFLSKACKYVNQLHLSIVLPSCIVLP